jgi:hypothetical protein
VAAAFPDPHVKMVVWNKMNAARKRVLRISTLQGKKQRHSSTATEGDTLPKVASSSGSPTATIPVKPSIAPEPQTGEEYVPEVKTEDLTPAAAAAEPHPYSPMDNATAAAAKTADASALPAVPAPATAVEAQ